ncbi:MAG: transcription antitermination factor NusB, partial [Bacillota bacterium]
MSTQERQVALEGIYRVNEEGAYSNLVLNQLLAEYDLSERDKSLTTELFYGTLRMRNNLDYVIEQFADRPLAKMDDWTRNILRLGLYQICFLDRIPAAAACNQSVELAKEYQHDGAAKFVNGIVRSILRNLDQINFPDQADKPVQFIRYKHSFPQWMVERWVKRFGVDLTIEICQRLNQVPATVIRRNPLQISSDNFRSLLAKESITAESVPNIDQAYRVIGSSSLLASDLLTAGYCQIQGLASILTGHLVAPQPKDRVLDLCSAPGGKTTHLAEL